ncbi:unnamed protein product [Amoebophrya sp. A120]|nr:unnamed protein product [Amoebophrya sp. A120]|eukprot:GSA120T00014492001.1
MAPGRGHGRWSGVSFSSVVVPRTAAGSGARPHTRTRRIVRCSFVLSALVANLVPQTAISVAALSTFGFLNGEQFLQLDKKQYALDVLNTKEQVQPLETRHHGAEDKKLSGASPKRKPNPSWISSAKKNQSAFRSFLKQTAGAGGTGTAGDDDPHKNYKTGSTTRAGDLVVLLAENNEKQGRISSRIRKSREDDAASTQLHGRQDPVVQPGTPTTPAGAAGATTDRAASPSARTGTASGTTESTAASSSPHYQRFKKENPRHPAFPNAEDRRAESLTIGLLFFFIAGCCVAALYFLDQLDTFFTKGIYGTKGQQQPGHQTGNASSGQSGSDAEQPQHEKQKLSIFGNLTNGTKYEKMSVLAPFLVPPGLVWASALMVGMLTWNAPVRGWLKYHSHEYSICSEMLAYLFTGTAVSAFDVAIQCYFRYKPTVELRSVAVATSFLTLGVHIWGGWLAFTPGHFAYCVPLLSYTVFVNAFISLVAISIYFLVMGALLFYKWRYLRNYVPGGTSGSAKNYMPNRNTSAAGGHLHGQQPSGILCKRQQNLGAPDGRGERTSGAGAAPPPAAAPMLANNDPPQARTAARPPGFAYN